ncbi:hypothetical protein E4U42_001385, partial [Claviceps africana]
MDASSLEKHTDGRGTEQEQPGPVQSYRLGTDAYVIEDGCDAKEESRIRLKMDLTIVPLVGLLYLLAFMDRSNI